MSDTVYDEYDLYLVALPSASGGWALSGPMFYQEAIREYDRHAERNAPSGRVFLCKVERDTHPQCVKI